MDSAFKDACDYTVYMHVAIDVREACNPKRTGKGQWTFGFVSELLQRDIEITLLADAQLPDEWKERAGVHVTIIQKKGFSWHLKARSFVKADPSIDVYIAPTSYIVPFLLGRSRKHITIVHDLIAFRGEPHDKRATLIERLTLGRVVKTAHRMCVVSETTKYDLIRKYEAIDPHNVVTIYAAPISEDRHQVDRGYAIFCVATLCPRKNQERLIQAFGKLSPELRMKHPLILAGNRGWQDAKIIKLIERTENVQWKKYVSENELSQLFKETMIFAYPSLYEGFGLPILDAMQRGIPVLTSGIGSMKEVAGDAAYLADPLSVDDMKMGLEKLLTDAELRTSLIVKGQKRIHDFSWKKTVDLFLAAAKDN